MKKTFLKSILLGSLIAVSAQADIQFQVDSNGKLQTLPVDGTIVSAAEMQKLLYSEYWNAEGEQYTLNMLVKNGAWTKLIELPDNKIQGEGILVPLVGTMFTVNVISNWDTKIKINGEVKILRKGLNKFVYNGETQEWEEVFFCEGEI